jgi:hypothetical protein
MMGCPFKEKCTSEDLLTLMNIIHCSVVDATSPSNRNLLLSTWWLVHVALSHVLPWSGALSSEVAGVTTIEADVVRGGSNDWWHRQAQHRRW